MNPEARPLWGLTLVLLFLLAASCGDDEQVGLADARTVSAVESSSSSVTSTTAPVSTSEGETAQEEASTSVEATTATTAPTTTASTTTTTLTTTSSTTSTTTTTTAAVAAGLPTADDVARQYYALCVETNSRELVDKWFEPGVLDDLNCRRSDEEDLGRGFTELSPCEEIPGAAGDATHGCFVYYEGGGYTLLVGDLGNGYRGLAATFVVD